MHCRVSKKFKLAIILYCAKNRTTERNLVNQIVKEILSAKNAKSLMTNYDIDEQGTDKWVLMVVKISEEDKINFTVFCKTTGLAERYVLAQGLARDMGGRKSSIQKRNKAINFDLDIKL